MSDLQRSLEAIRLQLVALLHQVDVLLREESAPLTMGQPDDD